MGLWATVVGLILQYATVAASTIAHLGLGFDCLGVKSPLCIYKQREDGRWQPSNV
jgi:hypothetical protein